MRRHPEPQDRPAADTALARRVADFLLHLSIERGLSVNTVDAYRRDLHQFCEFAVSVGLDDHWPSPGQDRPFLTLKRGIWRGERRTQTRRAAHLLQVPLP